MDCRFTSLRTVLESPFCTTSEENKIPCLKELVIFLIGGEPENKKIYGGVDGVSGMEKN